MLFAEMPVTQAEGAILAHSVRHASGTFKKGRVLDTADVTLLQQSGVERVFAARLEAGDVAEDEAAGTVARALAGPGARPQEPFTGRANVHAASAGVALIDATRIRALNRLHESLTLATVAPFEIVEPRQMLATVPAASSSATSPASRRAANTRTMPLCCSRPMSAAARTRPFLKVPDAWRTEWARMAPCACPTGISANSMSTAPAGAPGSFRP